MSYTLELVRQKLSTNQKWVERAIIKLYEFQTAEEKQAGYTAELNGKGFNSCDAKTFTYYAEWLMSGKNLSGKHLDKAFQAIPKYSKQILECINSTVTA
jgi:hypothetical protein